MTSLLGNRMGKQPEKYKQWQVHIDVCCQVRLPTPYTAPPVTLRTRVCITCSRPTTWVVCKKWLLKWCTICTCMCKRRCVCIQTVVPDGYFFIGLGNKVILWHSCWVDAPINSRALNKSVKAFRRRWTILLASDRCFSLSFVLSTCSDCNSCSRPTTSPKEAHQQTLQGNLRTCTMSSEGRRLHSPRPTFFTGSSRTTRINSSISSLIILQQMAVNMNCQLHIHKITSDITILSLYSSYLILALQCVIKVLIINATKKLPLPYTYYTNAVYLLTAVP